MSGSLDFRHKRKENSYIHVHSAHTRLSSVISCSILSGLKRVPSLSCLGLNMLISKAAASHVDYAVHFWLECECSSTIQFLSHCIFLFFQFPYYSLAGNQMDLHEYRRCSPALTVVLHASIKTHVASDRIQTCCVWEHRLECVNKKSLEHVDKKS